MSFVALVALAFGVRLVWVLVVPTVPVSDFAMYRESANYLSEFGALDPGFIYMPGFVRLLAWVNDLGGELLAQKLIGVVFGTLGAAALFVLTYQIVDREGLVDREAPVGPRRGPCPHAATATAIYALWPAAVGMTSVVGTDMPAAALLVTSLALLTALGPRRPWAGALAFGATLGLGAWIRAVALPLSGLALGTWLARRVAFRRALLYTAAGVVAALLVLLPWGIRHVRQSGELYFTDDHGGITALIGANPNSEGTYTRALNKLFKDVTGRSVLDEPHRQTDRLAYGMAQEWMRFEPAYALGLVAMKADRLFDPEHRLLYWSVLRPGVLVGSKAAFVGAHREAIVRWTDAFGVAVAALALAGIVLALARRRWALLSLVPFQAALAATYVLFFAEPRYRIPLEMLALPFVALALVEMAGALGAARRRAWPDLSRRGLALLGAALAAGAALALWPALLDGGSVLRARHRWAVTEVTVDGRMRTMLWAPAPPLADRSPLAGAPNGVRIEAAQMGPTGPVGPTRLRLRLGGGTLPPGRYRLRARLEPAGEGTARFEVAGQPLDLVAGQPAALEVVVNHPGDRLTFEAALTGKQQFSVWASDMEMTTLR